MKTNYVMAGLLIVLTFATVVGMVLKNDFYWLAYNCVVVLFSFIGASALMKQKS
jgi:hypothetical protein